MGRVIEPWHSTEQWGDEVALNVIAGDIVYISEVDTQGWARGTLLSTDATRLDARDGWLPIAACQRCLLDVVTPYPGDEDRGYVRIEIGDHVAIYHRQDDDWVY